MSEQEALASSSQPGASIALPWWIQLCGWLWKISGALGSLVVLSLVVNVFSTWLTTSQGKIPPDSPFGWLLAHWLMVLLIGSILLLLALLTGVISHQHTRAPTAISLAQQNRARMLQRLRRTYRDLLTQSLQGATWLELGLAHKPDAVQNATHLLLRTSQQTEQVLPPGTSIVSVYDEVEHELLILGEPGAGKSTLLLELAQQLVTQAEADEKHLLPIILPLSSWAVRRPALQDWLIEQLAQIYDISQQLAQRWVQEEQILPLLDGLDEMEETARPACIAAINAYHRAHLVVPLVVCSRRTEYENASKQQRLTLQGAVIVQPLTKAHVDGYLAGIGKSLAALRRALKTNPALQELATSPLMLNILMLTYQGTTVRALPTKDAQLQQQVWTDYVQRMVERKGNLSRYPLERTLSWLGWLAQQMRDHNQSIFHIEHLQADWLPAGQERAYRWLAYRLPAVLVGDLAGIFVEAFFFSVSDTVLLLQYSILGGWLGALLSDTTMLNTSSQAAQTQQTSWAIKTRLVTSAGVGLACGISFGFNLSNYYSLAAWLRDGSISGLVIGLSCLLLTFLLPGIVSRQNQSAPKGITRGRLSFLHHFSSLHWQRALLVAIVFGVGWGLGDGLSYGLGYALSDGLYYVPGFGGLSLLVSLILERQMGAIHLTERLRWSWGSLLRSLFDARHLRTSLMFAGICFLFFGLSNGLSNGLIGGLSNGLSGGLSGGLSYWLLLGLFQGVAPEQISDQDRHRFNQGIQYSLRNSLLMALISGGVFSIIGPLMGYGLWIGLSMGLSFGLSEGLSNGLSTELRAGWLFFIIGGLLVWIVSGGWAVLQHYTIRYLLWRTHTFSWKAQQFLDDATARILLRRVGGGYSFTHRLLLDYFADRHTISPRV